MQGKRRGLSAGLKAKVVLAAIQGDQRINQIATRIEVRPTQVRTWKRQFEEAATDLFSDRRGRRAAAGQELVDRL